MQIPWWKLLFSISIIFLLINSIYVDLALFSKNNNKIDQQSGIREVTYLQPKTEQTLLQTCPLACLNDIHQATASVTIVPTIITKQETSSAVKDFFIPFGSGSSTAPDWKDVPGLQSYINSNNYGKIKNVVFEVSVHVPTANETANVRLFDITDQHPVWFSEVFFTGGSNAQLLISQPITLELGNKLYQVQIKTQLQYEAIIDQSRLHITTY